MTGGEGFHHHKISIKMSSTSGIKESDAIKIEAVLKCMKVSGNTTVVNQANSCVYLLSGTPTPFGIINTPLIR